MAIGASGPGEGITMRSLAVVHAAAGMTCLLSAPADAAWAVDPIFANSYESGLVGFGPPLNEFSPSGADRPTMGNSLRVVLSAPAEAPTFVAVTSTNPSLLTITDGGVVVETGQTTAAVRVTCLVGDIYDQTPPVTVWASLGNTMGAAVSTYIPWEVHCLEGDSSDLLDFTRQCSGTVTSTSGAAVWDNTFTGLFRTPWPGIATQFGQTSTATIGRMSYGAFRFNTGSTQTGVRIHPNLDVGGMGLISINSTTQGPGYFPSGICYGTDLTISSKPSTTAACVLSANTDYYLNISSADVLWPHATTCASDTCKTGWTLDAFDD